MLQGFRASEFGDLDPLNPKPLNPKHRSTYTLNP